MITKACVVCGAEFKVNGERFGRNRKTCNIGCQNRMKLDNEMRKRRERGVEPRLKKTTPSREDDVAV